MKTIFKDFLLEMRYEDVFGRPMIEFIQKYKRLQESGEDLSNLYIRFTNRFEDSLDRTPYNREDIENDYHGDPVATYAYPIEYVINHISDIQYGAVFKYLLVLKDTSKNKLILSDINENIFNEEIRPKIKKVLKYSDFEIDYIRDYLFTLDAFKNDSKWGKLFFWFISVDIQFNEYEDKNDAEIFIPNDDRNPLEQNKILRKMGYDSIEDKAKTSLLASINFWEPEQILFLHKYSYTIEEIVKLRDMQTDSKELIYEKTNIPRKIANTIANILSDNLIGDTKKAEYQTKNGATIILDINDEQSSSVQKLHRANKTFDNVSIDVTITLKDKSVGEFKLREFDYLHDLYRDITNWKNSLKLI